MLFLDCEQLNVGSGFVFYGLSNNTVWNFPINICYLLDSGTEADCLSQRIGRQKQFPVEEGKISQPLLGFKALLRTGT